MRVLVTGASGFIGSHVTEALLKANHKVLALTLPKDDLWRLDKVLSKIDILRGSLNDFSLIEGEIQKWEPDACIHLAWYAEPGKYLESPENLASLNASMHLLTAMANFGCKHFISAGTCFEYAQKAEPLTEDDRTQPETLYAAAKSSFQLIGGQIAKQSPIRFSWGRIFYLYGRKEHPLRLVPAAILKILHNEVFASSPGEQMRDYLHVSDVADAFMAILENQAEGIYNICSGEAVAIKSIIQQIGSLTGKPELVEIGALPYRNWESMYLCGNNERLRALGWTAKVNLQEGLQDAIQYWQNAQ